MRARQGEPMDNFAIDVRSAGREHLELALRIGFRNGDRVATHVSRDRIRGVVFHDFREPGTSFIPGIERLPAPIGHEGAVDVALEWLGRESDWRDEDGAIPFRVHCSQGGEVFNEERAFVAVGLLSRR